MNSIYGFQGEVAAKVDSRCFELLTEVFNWLPLAALLTPTSASASTIATTTAIQPSSTALPVFVTHGGLFSTDDITLADIEKCYRNQQPPETGLMCEILWSDPQRARGRGPSKRGVGLSFGPDVTARFCEKNGVGMVVRSHEVKEEGYEVDHDDKLVTVFSAPNYCDTMDNKAAYIIFDGATMTPKYTKFTAVPHPKITPMAYAGGFMRNAGFT